MSSLASLRKELIYLKKNIRLSHPPSLTDLESNTKKKCENSFYEFVKWSWNLIEGVPFVEGWHIQAMCSHLELAYTCEIKSLIINVPPRTMKSTLLSMFNAWVWAKEPHLKFLCVSGTKRLAIKDSDRCRRIIESSAYRKLWGDRVHLRHDSKSKQSFENMRHGQRLSYSMQSSVRGEGGNFIIIDDGNTDQDYVSDVMREAKNEYFDSNLSLRLSDPKRMCMINVQQRIHQFDLTGHILSKGDTIHFRLPMEFESDSICSTLPLHPGEKAWHDPRTIDGELLWPSRLTKPVVEKMKRDLRTSYNIAGQLQQRPSPRQGGIIKKEWFRLWDRPVRPSYIAIIQSWDTAITVSKDSCYSACTTWGLFEDDSGYSHLLLLNAWRGKLEYPDLKKMIQRLSKDYLCQDLNSELKSRREPTLILMEKAANGMSLIQDLSRNGIYVTPFEPRHYGFRSGTGSLMDSSKFARASIASSLIEQGFVWLPMKPPDYKTPYRFAEMFLEATTTFPRGDGADLVDSMSQTFLRLMQTTDINYRGQKHEEERINWRQQAYRDSQFLEKNSNLHGRI